jgi:hypothetical protein
MILNEDGLLINENYLFKFVFSKVSSFVDDFTKEKVTKNINRQKQFNLQAESTLKKAGMNVAKCKALCEKEGKRVGHNFKNLHESTSSGVTLVEETSLSFIKVFTTIYDDITKAGDLEAGLNIFLILLISNLFVTALLSVLFGPIIASQVVGIFIGPFCEEYARNYAIKQGKGLSTFTAAINTYEFITYVSKALSKGIKLSVAISVRLLLVLLHQLMAALQKYGYLKDLKKGKSEESAGSLAFVLAVILHALSNAYIDKILILVFPNPFKEEHIFDDELLLLTEIY